MLQTVGEITVFEWPDRFLVETDEPDRDYAFFYPDIKEHTPPHFVDLSELREGWCSCRDFRFNVEPYLVNETHRGACSHIINCRRYRNLMGEKPKKLTLCLEKPTSESAPLSPPCPT